jgi:hypothetical protein
MMDKISGEYTIGVCVLMGGCLFGIVYLAISFDNPIFVSLGIVTIYAYCIIGVMVLGERYRNSRILLKKGEHDE